MAKVLLLDGNSLVYRAFFALPADMATASGQVTNAVFGFTSMLTYLMAEHRPDQLVVAFDRPEPNFRHQLVADYKAGRAETPDILRQQMGLVRQVLDTLGLPMIDAPGFEADDVLATLATQGRDRGDDVIVVTGDRDAYQLVEDPHIRVLYNRRGVSDYALYDEAGIMERTGVRPDQYPIYAALRGDPSDNLPGVPGVGEKTAARLVQAHGSLDAIFANLDTATPKLRDSLRNSEAQVRSNALATPLVRDVPLDRDLDHLGSAPPDHPALRELFTFLEFRALYDRLLAAMGDQAQEAAPAGESTRLEVAVAPAGDADAACRLLVAGPNGWVALAPAWLGEAGRSPLVGLAVAGSAGSGSAGSGSARSPADRAAVERSAVAAEVGATAEVGDAAELAPRPEAAGGPLATGVGANPAPEPVVWIGAELLSHPEVVDALAGVRFCAHGAKSLVAALESVAPAGRTDQRRPAMAGLVTDTEVAAYLIEPGQATYGLVEVARRFMGLDLAAAQAPPVGQLDLSGSARDPASEAATEAAGIARLAPVLEAALAARGLTRLYEEVERPLVRVLARMERLGVGVDGERLRSLFDEVVAEGVRLESAIYELAGERFLINSTPQLRRILFDKLGLVPVKKTKTGFSTDAASLARLAGQHPIIEPLLRYREVEKLRSTYGESLMAEVGADGRIHATFNQTVARTGRLSSDRPNLHNIPVRTEEGRRIRSAFVPGAGLDFLVADYNQIELRVIAHLADDPGLIGAFESGTDIHSATAARIFGVPAQEVTLAQRSKAKMVSYGLAYGMEAFGLGQRLAISTADASVILDAFFDAFPRVRTYMDATVAEARDRGYTETLFGRRRQIPELASPNFRIRQAGERQAMNAGIQGLAADIFKVALVRLDQALETGNLASRIVLQVHDEVILEVPPSEAQAAAAVTVAAMTGAADLRVPLDVNLSWGRDWASAKG
ncbi:MAG: DNA polymerase I [Acidimicrobiales bacterium]